MNASEPLRRNAHILPDEPAFVRSDASTVTYAEMERDIDVAAHRLRALPCGPGDIVALACDDVYRNLCITLALARLGAAVATKGVPPAIATRAVGVASVAGAIGVDELFAPGGARPSAPVPIHGDPDAVLAYCASSGTTSGIAKVVPFTHALMERRVAVRTLAAPPVPGARHAALIGLISMFGWQRFLRAIWSGYAVVEPTGNVAEIADWLVRTGVTFLSTSPMGLSRVLECLPPGGVRCGVRMIEVGGGFISPALIATAAERLPAMLVSSYGATETGAVAAAPVQALAGRPGAVGFAFPGVRMEVVDADGNVLPAGEAGQLRVRSPYTATEYYGDPAATARTFRDGWVYPNDNVVLDADGAVRIVGRVDDVIDLGGVKVQPQEMEVVLQTLADLREAAVYAIRGEDGANVLCAAVVVNRPVDDDALYERCVARFGRFAPSLIVKMPALPRNAMGKVQRTELARTTAELVKRPAAP